MNLLEVCCTREAGSKFFVVFRQLDCGSLSILIHPGVTKSYCFDHIVQVIVIVWFVPIIIVPP